jgi:hypothetical protein
MYMRDLITYPRRKAAVSTHSSAGRARRSSLGSCLAAVVAGALGGTVVWAILDRAMDGLTQPGFGSHGPERLGIVVVVVASLVGGVLAWTALVVVERVLQRGRRTWFAIVSVALVLSLGGPLSGTGVTTGDRMALVLLHATVAAIILPLLYRSAGAPAADHAEPR